MSHAIDSDGSVAAVTAACLRLLSGCPPDKGPVGAGLGAQPARAARAAFPFEAPRPTPCLAWWCTPTPRMTTTTACDIPRAWLGPQAAPPHIGNRLNHMRSAHSPSHAPTQPPSQCTTAIRRPPAHPAHARTPPINQLANRPTTCPTDQPTSQDLTGLLVRHRQLMQSTKASLGSEQLHASTLELVRLLKVTHECMSHAACVAHEGYLCVGCVRSAHPCALMCMAVDGAVRRLQQRTQHNAQRPA